MKKTCAEFKNYADCRFWAKVDKIYWDLKIIYRKNHTHVKNVGHTSEFLFGIYWLTWKTTITPLTTQKIKILKKMKKAPGDIIILHKCTKNHDLMLYCSWDMDTVINSTPNAGISKKHENRFFFIKLKIFYFQALNFRRVLKHVTQGLKSEFLMQKKHLLPLHP